MVARDGSHHAACRSRGTSTGGEREGEESTRPSRGSGRVWGGPWAEGDAASACDSRRVKSLPLSGLLHSLAPPTRTACGLPRNRGPSVIAYSDAKTHGVRIRGESKESTVTLADDRACSVRS